MIPPQASTATLNWSALYNTEEAPNPAPGQGQDRQEVLLLGPELQTAAILFRVLSNAGTWAQEQVDLTSYRGKSYNLYFNAFNNGNGLRTWEFLDDVSITVCYPPTTPTPIVPTSTWTPTPTNTPTITPAFVLTMAVSMAPDGSVGAAAVSINGEPVVIAAGNRSAAPPTETPRPIATFFDQPVGQVLACLGFMGVMLAVIAFIVWLIRYVAKRTAQPSQTQGPP